MGLFSRSEEKSTKSTTTNTTTTERTQANNVATPGPVQVAAEATRYRPICLFVWESAMFKAHWAIFIPEDGDRSCKKGKFVHAVGSLKDGFQFEVRRGYDTSMTGNRPLPAIEIGLVNADLVVDTPTGGQMIREAIDDLKDNQRQFQARDELEQFLANVPVPTKSLNSTTSGASRGKKVDISDCQWWTTRCVEALVAEGLLIAPRRGLNKDKDPVEIVLAAPRH